MRFVHRKPKRSLLTCLFVLSSSAWVMAEEKATRLTLTPAAETAIEVHVAVLPKALEPSRKPAEATAAKPDNLTTPPSSRTTVPSVPLPHRPAEQTNKGVDSPSVSRLPASPQTPAEATEPKMAAPTTSSPRAMNEPFSSDNWVARKAIGVQLPLRDPVLRDSKLRDSALEAPPEKVQPEKVQETFKSGEVNLKQLDISQQVELKPLDSSDDFQARASIDDDLSDEQIEWLEETPDRQEHDSNESMMLAAPDAAEPLQEAEVAAERHENADEDEVDEPSGDSALSDAATGDEATGDEAEAIEDARSDESADADSATQRPITMRDLLIERDGSPRVTNSRAVSSRTPKSRDQSPLEDPPAMEEVRPETALSPSREQASGRPQAKASGSIGDHWDLAESARQSPSKETAPATKSPTSESSASESPESSLAELSPQFERDYTGRPTEPLRLSPTVQRMQPALQRCLSHYYKQTEVANARSNWGMMHAMLVWGIDTKVIANNREYNAIAWIAGNNACRGQRLLGDGPKGIEVKSGVGLQGHQAQMLSVFALCNVPINYPLYVGTRKYSVEDVVKLEMADCRSGDELTFNLIGLAHYLDTEQTWIGADGRRWDFERLIREELSQPIIGQTCGGTHRLMGFDHALRKRRTEDRPITGQWLRAEKFTSDFVNYAYSLQNRDGSMSTDWFRSRQDNGNVDRKIQTTGHIVEWLLTNQPDSQLQDPRLLRAVQFLLTTMSSEPNREWEIGPKGHALRSLALFYERAYKVGPGWQKPQVATARPSSRR